MAGAAAPPVQVEITQEMISFGARASQHAAQRPGEPAITVVDVRAGAAERIVTWGELDAKANRTARLLAQRGVGPGTTVALALGNSEEHPAITLAIWKLGGCVLPLNPRMAVKERREMLELAAPQLVIAEWDGDDGALQPAALAERERLSPDPLPDVIAHPGKEVGSGGSTGRPKIIVDPLPWVADPATGHRPGTAAWNGLVDDTGFARMERQLIAGPLYHNAPFLWTMLGLFLGQRLVMLSAFDADVALDVIERHRPQFALLVPTMMRRMATRLETREADLTSMEAIVHTGGACSAELKERWIDILGGEHVYEAFGSNEQVGMITIRGDDWLRHPRSLGVPRASEALVLDEDDRRCPPGEIGEIFMRPDGGVESFQYLGAPPARTNADGFVSVGDLGWQDEEGWFYLADRRKDMIATGGVNVYPAEVEGALSSHPGVADVVVIGVPDEEWGRRVHAIVVATDVAAPPRADALQAHCREDIASYKIPKSFEFVTALPRDEFGKLRRTAMRADGTSPVAEEQA